LNREREIKFEPAVLLAFTLLLPWRIAGLVWLEVAGLF
jgi:hypothetical protein